MPPIEDEELDHHTPADLLELYEVLEWKSAVSGRMAYIAPKSTGMFVTRAEWGARPSRGVTRLDNPAGVTWHYEGPKMGSFPHSSCATKVRGIQSFHMDVRKWTDGAYNLIVCPHGYIYELRGRDVRSAANGTNLGNSSSHAICALIGQGDALTEALKQGLLAGRQWLMAGGTGTRTWGHRDWKATSCPGDPIYAWHKAGTPTNPTPSEPPPKPPEDDMFGPDDSDRLLRVHDRLAGMEQKLNEFMQQNEVQVVFDSDWPNEHAPVYIVGPMASWRIWVQDGNWLNAIAAEYGFDARRVSQGGDIEGWSRVHLDRIPLIGPEAPSVTT